MGDNDALNDAQLIERLLGRDRARADHALETIYRRHANAVFRYASMIAPSPEIASDAMQDAFIWFSGTGASRFDPSRGSIASLLCGVARNHVLRAQSNEARFVYAEDDRELDSLAEDDASLPDGFQTLDSQERERAIRQALAALPHEFREAVVLVEFEEFSYEEAAAIIGCPIGTIRSRLNRAKARLREQLAELFSPAERNAV